jgi:ribosomal protein L35
MPKMKTKKSAAKRFTLTASGKVKYKKMNLRHILEKVPSAENLRGGYVKRNRPQIRNSFFQRWTSRSSFPPFGRIVRIRMKSEDNGAIPCLEQLTAPPQGP